MITIIRKINALDWAAIARAFDYDGYTLLPPLLKPEDLAYVIALASDDTNFRTRINMARHRFGEDRYRYFGSPAPAVVAEMRKAFYRHPAPNENDAASALYQDERYHDTLAEHRIQFASAGQTKPSSLHLQYESGGYKFPNPGHLWRDGVSYSGRDTAQ